MASISFELAEQGFRLAGALSVAIGLALGAVAFYFADLAVDRLGGRASHSAGSSLALGALLDGIPEQAVLGIGIAGAAGVSVALLVAIFASNLPEAIGSASDMRAAGHPTKTILLLWTAVAMLCAGATVGGNELQEFAGNELQGTPTDSRRRAAGHAGLLDDPRGKRKSKDQAGLAAVLGFAATAAETPQIARQSTVLCRRGCRAR